jgi:hypothetical protein
MDAFSQRKLQPAPVTPSLVVSHRSYLEQRCVERGYALADVMPCVVSQDGDFFVVDVASPFYPRDTRETVAAENHPPVDAGPGTELKKLLAGWPFYITSSPDCSCNRVAREMDAWGADECEKPERVDYVLAALRQNAAKRGIPFLDAAGRMLVRRAIRNARREASRVTQAETTTADQGSDPSARV